MFIEFNRELVAWEGVGFIEQLSDDDFGQHDGQQAIFKAIVEENISEARRDQRAKTILLNRPRRVLAAGAAAEVFPAEHDACTLVSRLVEHKIRVDLAISKLRIRLAHIEETFGIKQIVAKARFADALQKLL